MCHVMALAPAFLLPMRPQDDPDQWSLELINSWIDAINAAATGNCADILTKAVHGIEIARDTQGVFWDDQMPYLGFVPNSTPENEARMLISKRFQPSVGADGVSPLVDGVNIGHVFVHEGLHATFDPEYQLRGTIDRANVFDAGSRISLGISGRAGNGLNTR